MGVTWLKCLVVADDASGQAKKTPTGGQPRGILKEQVRLLGCSSTLFALLASALAFAVRSRLGSFAVPGAHSAAGSACHRPTPLSGSLVLFRLTPLYPLFV